MGAVTWLPFASDGHQLVLAFPAQHKLQPLPGLLILVGVLCMQNNGVDPTHQDNLQPLTSSVAGELLGMPLQQHLLP